MIVIYAVVLVVILNLEKTLIKHTYTKSEEREMIEYFTRNDPRHVSWYNE